MRSRTKIVPIRLTPAELEALDGLLKLRKYPSRTAAIVAGLNLLFTAHKLKRSHECFMEGERKIHRLRRARSEAPRFGPDAARQDRELIGNTSKPTILPSGHVPFHDPAGKAVPQ